MNDANRNAALASAAAVLVEANRLGIDTTRLAAAYRELSRQGAPVRRSASRKVSPWLRNLPSAAHNCRSAGCGPVCTFGDW